jgi:heat shock protein HslJ
MAFIMTTAGATGCNHGGSALLTSSAKLKIAGKRVLLANAVTSWTILTGCGQTGSGQKICTKFTNQTAGQSTKVKVNGQPVVLDSFSGLTDGKPDVSSKPASAGQTKFQAV